MMEWTQFSADNLKWIIIMLTIGLSVWDFYLNKIPNWLNMMVFQILLIAALTVSKRPPILILQGILVVSLAVFLLFWLGVIGGGDCKYLIALSPLLPFEAVFKILLLGMIVFVATFYLLKGVKGRNKSINQVHKCPFIWSLLPGIYMFLSISCLFINVNDF